MATLREVGEAKISITFVQKRGFIKVLYENILTLSVIAFCVYISRDSTFWTFITGGMFLFIVLSKMKTIMNDNIHTFHEKQKAIDFLNEIDKGGE